MQERKSEKKATIKCINYEQLQAVRAPQNIFVMWCSQIILLFQVNPEAPNTTRVSQAICQQNRPRHKTDHRQLSCLLFLVFKVSTE